MRNLAILVGEAGAGKSTIARGLKEVGAAVIHGDDLVHWAAVRLAPFINPGREWDWPLWKAIIATCDVRPAFRSVVAERCRGVLDGSEPVVAEACLFGLPELRDGFVGALRAADPRLAEPAVFWLDVPPDVLAERIKARGRRTESGIGIDEAGRRIAYYSGHISAPTLRSPSSEEVTDAIRSHLGLRGPQ